MEHCGKLAKETGASASDLFKNYLKLMRKYADYFFSKPWPEKPDKPHTSLLEFISEEDEKFIRASKGYEEECEHFTIVCLRRNISMEGFDSEGFISDFNFLGNLPCWDCVVSDVMWLRNQVKLVEQSNIELEGKMKSEDPSLLTRESYEHQKKPEVIREDKMLIVNLKFFEEFGEAEGKSCEVKNKYKCPYKEESERLIKNGRLAEALWHYIEWYDEYWNRSLSFTPPASDLKWHHYDEPGIIDVTSYYDILKAINDGRLKRIVKECKEYEKAHKG